MTTPTTPAAAESPISLAGPGFAPDAPPLCQLIELATDALLLLDATGAITSANAAAQTLAGDSAPSLVGRDWTTALALTPLAGRAPATWLTAGTGATQTRAVIRRRDDTERTVDVTLQRATPPASGWLLAITDVSDHLATIADRDALARLTNLIIEEFPAFLAITDMAKDPARPFIRSKYAERVTGWSLSAWDQDPAFTFNHMHPDDLPGARALLADMAEQAQPFTFEYRLRRPAGDYIWVREEGNPVFGPDGNLEYWIGFLFDVTAVHTMTAALTDTLAELHHSNAALQRVSATKSAYLSIMSHEFRTPLTSIMGFSELIAAGDLTLDETVRFAELICTSSQRLNRLIGDLLDLDRLEAGTATLRREPIALPDLLHDVVEGLAGLGNEHQLVITAPSDLPEVPADRDLLMQVVTNIVANAIKYTPAGGQITIAAQRAADAIEIRVTDTGPGIPADALEAVFSRFARLDRPHDLQVTGSGLGLAIARQITEQHSGRIWAEQAPAGGACFIVRLPLIPPADGTT